MIKYSEIISVLDIGNTKVTCCIARVLKSNKIEILGSGFCACNGMNLGIITEMESVQKSISKAIENAENQAKYRVKSVYVSVSGINLKSYIDKFYVSIGGRIITKNDIDRALSKSGNFDRSMAILHKIPITYTLDSLKGIKNPVGMVADKIRIDAAVIAIPKSQLNNILLCLSKCHLDVEEVVASPYSLGIAIGSNDDTPQSIIVIDLGGGTTVISFLYKGIFCGTEVIPFGGAHITSEIANKLGITYSDAERLKVLYGAALPISDSDNSPVLAPVIGESNYISMQQISKTAINQIVISKVQELSENIKQRINNSIFGSDFSNTLIVSGGASQIIGINDILAQTTGKKVLPFRLDKLIAFSDTEITLSDVVSLGLVMYAQINIENNESELDHNSDAFNDADIKNMSLFKKVIFWLKENL